MTNPYLPFFIVAIYSLVQQDRFIAQAYCPERDGAVFGSQSSLKPTHQLSEVCRSIESGGIRLELVSVNGETKDALCVWCPEQGVLFCGDLFYKS